jgi:hypothetical protein
MTFFFDTHKLVELARGAEKQPFWSFDVQLAVILVIQCATCCHYGLDSRKNTK